MDPASVVGVIGVAAQITQAIYIYGDAVKDCKTEVAQLRSELFGMQAALTQIEQDLTPLQPKCTRTAVSPSRNSLQFQKVLDETWQVLQTLACTLKEPSSKADALKKKLVWPLKRAQVQALATHLERLKTFFILVATGDSLRAVEDLQYSINSLQESVDEIQQRQKEEAAYLEAMRCLAPYDPNSAHTNAATSRLAGTNSWFLDKPFQDWVSGTSSLLWVRGKPGSGKICLMSACADRLLNADCVVAFFYCSYNDSSSQQPQNILGAFLSQLCQQSVTVRSLVLAAYQESKSRNALHDLVQVSTLASLLGSAAAALSTDVFVFVDAADECGDRLIPALEALFRVVTLQGRIRLMLSSTENVAQTIRECLSRQSISPDDVSLDSLMVGRDINSYIHSRFAHESKLRRLRPDLQELLIKKIQSQHQGSFRWTSCTIDDLLRRSTPRAIKTALNGVASSLGEIYLSTLKNIPGDMAETAMSMLQYLVSAMRPLTLNELGEVASLVFTEGFGEDDRLLEPEATVKALHNLVHCNAANQRIELAHSSVRMFLTDSTLSGQYYIDPATANAYMSKACVYYLALPPFQTLCPDVAALAARKREWPFFEYAAFYWTRHARRMTECCDEFQTLFARFAAVPADNSGEGQFTAWYQCVYPQGHAAIWATSPLYMCAREGLLEPLKALLARRGTAANYLEQRGGARGSTALHVAATYGEVDAVRLLLAAGADPNERNSAGESGIQLAEHFGHCETVRLLLEAGADPALLTYRCNWDLYTSFKASIARYTGTEVE